MKYTSLIFVGISPAWNLKSSFTSITAKLPPQPASPTLLLSPLCTQCLPQFVNNLKVSGNFPWFKVTGKRLYICRQNIQGIYKIILKNYFQRCQAPAQLQHQLPSPHLPSSPPLPQISIAHRNKNYIRPSTSDEWKVKTQASKLISTPIYFFYEVEN